MCTSIVVDDSDNEHPQAAGGENHWFFPWVIDDSLLHPIAYNFDVHKIPGATTG